MFELSMESLSSKYLMWVFILLLVQICECKGCIEEEKMGLLEFKAFLKLNDEHADFLLPSWLDNNTSECCNWERVICNPTTGQVKKLFLNDIRQQQNFLEDNWYYYENAKFWLLNVSLFLPFEELHHLNLSANSFDGFIENEGFKRLSSLKKLEILDISGNEFDKSALKSLGTITSLKTLAICSMGLNGSFSIRELASLRNLEVLDLSYNDLESFQLLQDSQGLSIFKKLETLNLNHNKFKNTSLQQLNIFTSLKNLSLGWNYDGGFFPIQELCTLENLVMLDLSGNFFIGMQGFKSLSKLKKLEILNLGYNWFNKTIIKQLSGLTSLKTLVVSNNYIEGLFPSQELSIFGNLMTLDLSWNRFNGSLSIQDFASLSNLEVLDLSDNSFSGIVPSSIRLLSSLKSLSLARNYLNGSLPNQEQLVVSLGALTRRGDDWLHALFSFVGFCQLNKLQELDLSYNLFQGILPPCLNNLTSLRLLDLSSNLFSGNLSSPLLPNLASQEYIDLSYNQFEGSFSFSSFANHSNLQVVKLGRNNNKFEVETEYPVGWVPLFQLEALMLSNLVVVDLSHNNLTRRFANWLLENNTRLEFLALMNNSLMGQLLPLRPNTRISSLDISHNQLDGQLQENVVHMIQNIMFLNLSNNGFKGIIPSSIA
ncbi:receptor like protein 21-like [Vitis vinifera]|uniref:receptor like protein 21-like n=1 Tax=Vitis vinifera TaxID=29760 RepID=UPI0028834B83|nr:receptor like protein 21-like [Vitis vinifera]